MSTSKDLSSLVDSLQAKAAAKPAKAAIYQAKLDSKIAAIIAKGKTVIIDGATVTSYDLDTGSSGSGSSGGSSTTGSTYTMSTNIDAWTGTNSNETIIGDAATIVTADQIDGGGGTDTIKIYDLAAATDVPTLANVEVVELINANAPANLDLTGVTAMTTLVLDNATNADDVLIGSAVAVTLRGMADGEAVTLTSRATDTTHDLTVTNMGSVAGAGVTVNADGAAVTTINLASSGTVAAETDSDIILASTGTETTVNVTGSGDLALTTAATVVTINASAFTGNLTLADHTPTAATSITTGTGNDTVTAAAAVNYTVNLGAGNDVFTTANLNVSDSIVGGDGNDVLAISEADADALDANTDASNAILAKITGFEILRTTDDLDGTALAINRFGFNQLQMAAATTADTVVSGFTSGATVTKRDVNDDTANASLTVTMTGATNAGTDTDTLNISLSANLTATETYGAAVAGTALLAVGDLVVSNFDIAGINIVNVTSADRDNADVATDRNDGYVIDLEDNAAGSNSASLTALNISGSAATMYVVEAATTALESINASAATGDVLINADDFAGVQGLTITGGSGTNRILGSDLSDVIVGGGRADSIDAGYGADVMTGGAGADQFFFASEATASTEGGGSPSATNLDTISDWQKGVDLIALHDEAAVAAEVNVAVTVVANAAGAAGTAVINAQGVATFNAADDTLAERIVAVEAGIAAGGAAAAGQTAIFEFGSDSYVFISGGTDGVGAEDTLVKLTGITGITSSTINGNGDITFA